MEQSTPDIDILGIVNAELSAIDQQSLTDPLNYYLGNKRGDEVEGRSSVISTDVADSIEWLMPDIMASFTSDNEVVVFDATSEADEDQAQLETEFVYSQLMKKNEGFLVLHTFIKDCLLHKNGIIKAYVEKEVEQKVKEYTGLTDSQIYVLTAEPNVKILAHSQSEVMDEVGQSYLSHDVRIAYVSESPKICLENVPRERFVVNSDHNSLCLKHARFSGHIETKTISELVEYGYDYETLLKLPQSDSDLSSFRYQDGETSFKNTRTDDAMRMVDVGEFYTKVDTNGDGVAELKKIVGGMNGDQMTEILSIEDVDENPFISTTAILMSHRFDGLSIYDRIKTLQDQKTSLIRNILDNIYFINNQEFMGVEGKYNVDDFSLSAPGRLKRVKDLNSVAPIPKGILGQEVYTLLDYVDKMRAGRTGVSAEGSSAPQDVGNNVGSEGVDRLMSSKEALVGLIIRVIAETGIKPLCIRIRDLMLAHFDVVSDYRFRGKWMKVQPNTWPPRSETSIRVGTGSANKAKQVAAINQVIMLQEKLAMAPNVAFMLTPNKVYSAIDDFCKFSGLNGAERYFVDPNSNEGMAAKEQADQSAQALQQKQDEIEQLQLEMQNKLGESAMQTAQAQLQAVAARNEADRAKSMLQEEKQSYERELAILKEQVKQAQHSANLEFDYDKLAVETLLKMQAAKAQEINNLSEQLNNDTRTEANS